MQPITHVDQPIRPWRPDVQTRLWTAAALGASQLCMFEQWSQPGAGAPTHHHAVEETITILAGQADLWLDDCTITLVAGQTLIIAAGHPHGFRNTGSNVLHTLAVLASPVFEAAYDDAREVPRRWLPGTTP